MNEPSLDLLLQMEASSIRFVVSGEMIARFAALTGDRSSLHVNEAVARRSAYRRPVAHGMLPVAFLALSAPFRAEGSRCVPVAVSGRFIAPVYAGDVLTLTTGVARAGTAGDELTFDFRIENEASGAAVTLGEFSVAYRREIASVAEEGRGSAEMLVRPLELNDVRLEQVEKGMVDRVGFRVSVAAARDLAELLALGAGIERLAVDATLARVELQNLMAVLLFSTSVGVSMPGASATFLEFSARVEQDLLLDTEYALEGEVVHRSLGTRIIKKQIMVRDAVQDGIVVIRGKVATLVNKPSRRMPSMAELRESAMGFGLEGKVVLVTGASRGIGETIAKLVALHGAKVVVNYHRGAADAERVVGEICEAGGEAIAIAADVSSESDVAMLVARAEEHYGGVDILVNNAVRDFRPIAFADLTWEEIQKDVDVIARGAFLCCKQVIPRMLARGGGKIINISTVAVDDPPADQTKYVMAKSALVGLTRSLSVELASRNIQVNMVVPNFVETDLVAHIQDGFRKKIAHETPMGRHASPVDVAQAVVFLASSQSSFTTGQKIMVTGGGAPYA